MSEQTPSKQPTAPGDPTSGDHASEAAIAGKQPASNWDYADGFMMGLEDRGWTRLDRELEDDIREQVDSLLEKLDVTGLEVRIGSLERALARVEGERDQQLRRVAELERELAKARQERDFQQERAQVNVDLREEAKARITALEREVEEMRRAWDQTRLVLDGTCQILRDVEDEGAEMERERDEARARIAELERERDSAAALANALLLDIGQIAEALGSEASEPAALLADAQALKARVAELEDALRGLAARYHRDAHEGDGIPEDAHEWDTAQRVLLGKEAT